MTKSSSCKRFLRIFLCALLVFLFVLPTTLTVQASDIEQEATEELDKNVEELLSELDLRKLQEYVNSLDFFRGESVADRLMDYIKGGGFDYKNMMQALSDVLFKNVKELFPAFVTIAAIALLSGLLTMLKSGTIGQTSSDMTFLICYAAALIPLIGVLSECFEVTMKSVGEMHKQMQIIYPILLTLMAASGSGLTVAVCKPAVAFFSQSIVSIITNVIFPISITIVAFSMAANLTKELKISKFTSFFKSMNKWIMGICISIFGLFFTLQGITASVYDGVVRRTAKYAIGNGIPIVGGFLSGGFDLAVAGSILIKNSLGSFSIVLMVFILFEPLVLLIAVNVLLRLTAAITQPFGDSRISDFLGETADNLRYCTAGLLFIAFAYFLSIVLMVLSTESLL